MQQDLLLSVGQCTLHGAVRGATPVHVIAVDAWCTPGVDMTVPSLATALEVDILEVECMNMAREVAEVRR